MLVVGAPRSAGGGRGDNVVKIEVEVEPSTETAIGTETGDCKGESRT
jgi:hypothetical protein